MKSFLLLSIFSLAVSLSAWINGGKEKLVMKTTTITLLLDDYVCSESQWVYLRGFKEWVSGNEVAIFDSVYVEKGQQKVTLQFDIPFESEFRVLFSKREPVFYVVAEPGSTVIMPIGETDGDVFSYKKAIRGKMNNDRYAEWEEMKAYRAQLKDLMEQGEEDRAKVLQENRYRQLMKKMKTAHCSMIQNSVRTTLLNEFPSKSTEIRGTSKLLAKKFPLDKSLQESVKNIELSPMSADSRKAYDRFNGLLENKLKVDTLDVSLGSKLDLSFSDLSGHKVSTEDEVSDYVFVDFWASWCRPCRKETPYLKQTLKKYGDKLSVYAVSIDSNHQAWRKAIEQDSTQMFRHVIGTYPNGQQSRLLKQLNITSIPANFLLSKERRIVAKDLRGEELMQTMDSLMAP